MKFYCLILKYFSLGSFRYLVRCRPLLIAFNERIIKPILVPLKLYIITYSREYEENEVWYKEWRELKSFLCFQVIVNDLCSDILKWWCSVIKNRRNLSIISFCYVLVDQKPFKSRWFCYFCRFVLGSANTWLFSPHFTSSSPHYWMSDLTSLQVLGLY